MPAENNSRSFARVSDMHAQGNRRSKDDGELYRQHRERLTATIDRVGAQVLGGGEGASEAPSGRLCLLGAGNCNDVDLVALARRFQTMHLVDIDGAALDRARARQPAELRSRLVLHAGVDLTGLLDPARSLAGRRARPGHLGTGDRRGRRGRGRNLADRACDLAVSCCLMSQLGWSLEAALEEVRKRDRAARDTAIRAGQGGPQHGPGRAVEIRLAMLTIHLRTLAALVRPGGAGLLASDITSSDLYPLDELDPRRDLRALADELVPRQQVVYAGANPVLTSRVLRKDPVLKHSFATPVTLPPWLWTGQFDRTYLVYPQQLPGVSRLLAASLKKRRRPKPPPSFEHGHLINRDGNPGRVPKPCPRRGSGGGPACAPRDQASSGAMTPGLPKSPTLSTVLAPMTWQSVCSIWL